MSYRNTVVIGAPFDYNGGSVHVYKETKADKWEMQDKITPEDNEYAHFGGSVDIDEESRMVIGARVSHFQHRLYTIEFMFIAYILL